MLRRVIRILSAALIVSAMTLVSSPLPALAQPSCGHDYCEWYKECTWQFWAWDSGVGWTLLDTDGSC